jgi:hypothetical protein
VEGTSLENAQNNALDAIITRLAIKAGIEVTGSIKQELRSSLTESSYSEEERMVKTNEIKFKTFHALFHNIHEYSVTKNGKWELWVLYEVSNSGKTFKPYIPKYTNHYGGTALWRSMILPGWGQFYKKKTGKGVIILTTEVAAISGLAFCEMKRADNWRKSTETTNINITKEYRNRADSWELRRNIFVGVAAGVYLWNVLDAALAKGKLKYAWMPDNLNLHIAENNGIPLYGIAFNF